MTIASDVSGLLSRLGSGPIFVHSDPFRAVSLVSKTRDREVFIDSHVALLKEISGERSLWMPAFNYDFPRTHSFEVKRDPSQLGPIPERFRVTTAEWRTPIPIFSASGTGPLPEIGWKDSTDPFGDESLFARLVEADGVILYYGDTFHFNTIVHYAERFCGPPYRYDKIFPGEVIRADGVRSKGNLVYHVRPLGMGLEYDWAGILTRALAAGACARSEDHPRILASSASSLTDFLVGAMRDDHLALLDAPTREWVAPALQKLGRRFVIEDFEGTATFPST